MKASKYPVEVRPLNPGEGGGFLAIYPDLPGCMADGPTPEEAVHEVIDAAESWLKTAEEFGDPVPRPRTGGESGRFLARIPKSLHARLTARAKQEGVSMNTLLVALLSDGLKHHTPHG